MQSILTRVPGTGIAANRVAPLVSIALLLPLTVVVWGAATSLGDEVHPGSQHHPGIHNAVVGLTAIATTVLVLAGIAVLSTPRRGVLRAVEVAVLGSGVVLTLGMLAVGTSHSDESVLTNRAATAILRHQPVYGVEWPGAFVDGVSKTPTMDGQVDLTYAYPPLAPVLAAFARLLLGHSSQAVQAVCTVFLVLGAIAAWVLVPAPWRSLVPGLTFGTPLISTDARAGFPEAIALALLVPVLAGWDRIGAGGRIRAVDVGRAVLLGLACATQQLVWFVAPFLLVALWRVRRQELGRGRAAVLLGTHAVVALVAFLAVNLPFLLAQPKEWLDGLLLPMLQGAIVHGQGLIVIGMFLTPGSGAVAAYSVAQVLLLLALLALLACFPARLAPALLLLPVLSFLFGTRSSSEYLVVLLPLVLLTACTVDHAALARIPPLLRGRAAAVVGGAALVPFVAACVVAVAVPPPFTGRVEAVARERHAVTSATVRLENTSGTPITPHFVARAGTHPSLFWRAEAGPATLAPGERATYRLVPPDHDTAREIGEAGAEAVVMVLSEAPTTVTNIPFPK